MNSAKFLSLALVLIVAGVVCGRASHSGESAEESDSNLLKVASSFKLSMPLFMRNAIDAFTGTTTPPCQISSCQNGGTLKQSANGGSCPTCECAMGCSGAKCETCSSVSTATQVSTTNKYNCDTIYCMNGFSAVFSNNGSCWCNCSAPYHGEFCEYRNWCEYSYGIYCTNGGKSYYSVNSGCRCICPSCYSDTYCQMYPSCDPSILLAKPNCSMFDCKYGVKVYDDTGCKCVCSQGYAGDYCELQITCGSCANGGSPYYDPVARSCKCDCAPGFHGNNCYYSN